MYYYYAVFMTTYNWAPFREIIDLNVDKLVMVSQRMLAYPDPSFVCIEKHVKVELLCCLIEG